MLFNSWAFFVFFILFVPIYAAARANLSRRNATLLIASYIFYGVWDSRFLILVAASTSVDYCAALGASGKNVPLIDRLKSAGFFIATAAAALVFAPNDLWIVPVVAAGVVVLGGATALIDLAPLRLQRKLWLTLSLGTNLGILGFFKYFNFFVNSISDMGLMLGVKLETFTVSIILPVGLSFYTFQAIGRTIDSYRGVFDPQYNLLNYAAYHAFFPQLVAGPIERASHLMPQFEKVLPITREKIISGAKLFAWGAYKKIVIADNLAPIADNIFRTAGAGHSSAEIVVAILAFTFQIYGDFSGYSDMARGLARMLGFDLTVNFNLPFLSRTPSEFWRRWHISLSAWLRDYVYIPFGGNRGGDLIVARNLMLTMLVGGLWHGAAWTFVMWGAFHGAIQVIYRVLGIDALLDRVTPARPVGMVLHSCAWLATFILVMVGWVFFRARSFHEAISILGGAVGIRGYGSAALSSLVFYLLPLIAVEVYQRFSGQNDILQGKPFFVSYTLGLVVLLAIAVLGATEGRQFIYFDF